MFTNMEVDGIGDGKLLLVYTNKSKMKRNEIMKIQNKN